MEYGFSPLILIGENVMAEFRHWFDRQKALLVHFAIISHRRKFLPLKVIGKMVESIPKNSPLSLIGETRIHEQNPVV